MHEHSALASRRTELITLSDSRRLTGPNILWDRPGAVLDVMIPDELAESVINAWRTQARRILDAVGWGAEELQLRRFNGGASLALSAPLDALYAATEVNEWALAAAEQIVRGAPAPEVEEPAHRLREIINSERKPALLALRRAAAQRGVTFLVDSATVSVGSGRGSCAWPVAQLPSPEAVEWHDVYDVPTVLVTGSNGKTTTARLLAAVAAAAGRTPGVSCTDGVAVGNEPLSTGDWSGPGGARMVLRDRRVEVAVLETARGGVLRRGLAVTRADAAIVTNIAEDHFGEFGISDLPSLMEAKFVVARAVVPSGRVVLNADDDALARAPRQFAAPITWLSLNLDNAVVSAHVAAGGDACVTEGGALVLVHGNHREVVARVDEVPITLGGAARHNVANALGVVALAAAVRLPLPAVARALRTFQGGAGENPGRLNVFDLGGVRVVVDFAHNPHGMDALVATARELPALRRLIILGQAGDRDDAALRAFARSAWGLRPDRIVLKEMDQYRRGRRVGEVPGVLAAEFGRLGVPAASLEFAASEIAAVRAALAWARPGDLLLFPTHSDRAAVLGLLERLRNHGWKPGDQLE